MKTHLRHLALVLLLCLLAAACGGGRGATEEETAAAGGEQETAAEGEDTAAAPSDEPIRLVVNPWTGSAINANVAKVILENELDQPAEIVEIDENSMWAGLAAGDLDAVLEYWPSGHAEPVQTYIEEEGTVVDGGPLGAVGQIGWFIPTYLLEEHPELATWEGLNDNVELFQTAETGDKGQFLAGDPAFVQFDAQIIENLGLNYEVVQTGSEAALISAMQAAYERQEPLLMYFYTPQWLNAQLDLSMVELPEYTEECGALPEEERNCGYPEDVLTKAFTAGLEERAPQAFEFLSNLEITNEQQNEMAVLVDVEGMSPADAAARWVEENPDVWQEWLPS